MSATLPCRPPAPPPPAFLEVAGKEPTTLTAICPTGQHIVSIVNPWYGDATRNSTTIYSYLVNKCLYQPSCVVTVHWTILGDPAPGFAKSLRFSIM